MFPLGFVLLPAIGDVVHKDGSAVVTDLILLGLAGYFIYWSVNRSWAWYDSTRSIRLREDKMLERGEVTDQAEAASRARNKLYYQELMAILVLFLSPLVSATLLHYGRTCLTTRAKEQLSDSNIAIFVSVSEIFPLRKMMELVEARTLHLQRIVHFNPYRQELATAAQIEELERLLGEVESRLVAISQTTTSTASAVQTQKLRLDQMDSRMKETDMAASSSAAQVKKLVGRLDKLESKVKIIYDRPIPVTPKTGQAEATDKRVNREELEATIASNVRKSIEKELVDLADALRRHETKVGTLVTSTQTRLGEIDTQLKDAMSIATEAKGLKRSRLGLLADLLADKAFQLSLVPIEVGFRLLTWPARSAGWRPHDVNAGREVQKITQ
ncbi:hypothetical protein QBC47DRAFT_393366 [Echria macrotheca]|uniref:t-SNARE coiled-coil homology domain-containing protein n=1 Tax=Echria macrotheca TaxID=438768 RepID=A0AAJ0B2Z4_9PEZI|nr:hypothetical protein QBC47DRAFT_393366 [Echria macrotheca]